MTTLHDLCLKQERIQKGHESLSPGLGDQPSGGGDENVRHSSNAGKNTVRVTKEV